MHSRLIRLQDSLIINVSERSHALSYIFFIGIVTKKNQNCVCIQVGLIWHPEPQSKLLKLVKGILRSSEG